MRRAIPVLLILLSLSSASADDMATGWAAYDGGDYPTARAIWRDLADSGDADAMVALAGLFEQGVSTLVDPELARRLYRRAARLGNADAMQNLAEMLEHGRAGQADRELALCWYRKAEAAGRSWAGRQADRLALVVRSADC